MEKGSPERKRAKLNLPNRLTVLRLVTVPFCVAAAVMPESVMPGWLSALIALVLFIAASVTDALDGHIARKYSLITDLGKFLDPLADKFLVIGVMLAAVYRYDAIRPWFFWVVFTVIFRELAVTSLRLVAVSSGSRKVIAAGWTGKIKTVCQMICICAVLGEPLICRLMPEGGFAAFIAGYRPLTLLFSALTVIFTLLSAVIYFKRYGGFLLGSGSDGEEKKDG